MSNPARLFAQVLGVVLTLVGILGFIPGLGGPDGNLLGIFAINPTHNIIHILTGLVGLAAGFAADGRYARTYALVFGIVYLIVTIVGFIQGNTILGIIPTNLADNLLHTLITIGGLGSYFLSSPRTGSARVAA